ncbi:dienelactone hydrolase family protein [Reyranella sp.]|uniref:dienelactone hydrolase family protein n=1 Tax=Reyranella sp. TaxID=1929291 RepID=UPI0040354344
MHWLKSLLYAAVALAVTASACHAGSLVEISGGGDAEKSLPAYLARPSGNGPFPAIVVLHGCGGINGVVVNWADRLAGWGYVAVAPDSLTPKGRKSSCSSGASDQVHDSYRALSFLAGQPFVRGDRIGLMGISLGAGATLAAFERDGIEKGYPEKFRAAIAFYPPCSGSSGTMSGPTLVMVGERDDWTPADDCRAMVAGESAIGTSRKPDDRSMVELVVYPDTHHSFLDPNVAAGAGYLGHWLQYNKAAANDAIVRAQRFWERWLEQ